ncbi:acyl-CoA--6-aminopenicillanic acid acyl-transferase [Thermopirellula anaerolimosa]
MITLPRRHVQIALCGLAALCAVAMSSFLPPALHVSAEDGVFGPARTYDQGELRYVEGVPVIILRGSPEQRGRQEAAFALNVAEGMLRAPRDLLALLKYPGGWEAFLRKSRPYLARIPDHHRREIEGMVSMADDQVTYEDIAAANVIPDLYRSFACSSLVVLPGKSDDGKVRFGRNLDFFSVGILDRLSVVKIYLPDEGRLRFASIGFPGMVGCLSGINEAGLALAVHEVHLSSDGSPFVAEDAMPYTMMLREVLETCRNVDEAAELLRTSARSTRLNIVMADPQRAQVVEFTPANLAVREPEDGILACTNHFRTPELRSLTWCSRYPVLREAANRPHVSRSDIITKLDEVNMRFLTVQSMVFEPEARQLYLALGKPPVTRGPYRRIDLSPWLARSRETSGAAESRLPSTAVR